MCVRVCDYLGYLWQLVTLTRVCALERLRRSEKYKSPLSVLLGYLRYSYHIYLSLVLSHSLTLFLTVVGAMKYSPSEYTRQKHPHTAPSSTSCCGNYECLTRSFQMNIMCNITILFPQFICLPITGGACRVGPLPEVPFAVEIPRPFQQH